MSDHAPNGLPLSYQESSPLGPSVVVAREGPRAELTFHPSDLDPATPRRISRKGALSAAPGIAMLLLPIALFAFVARQVFFGSPAMAALTLCGTLALIAILGVLGWYIPVAGTLAALRRGRKQYTHLFCDGQSLAVTTRGPFGDFERTFEKQTVADLRVVSDVPTGPTGAGGAWLEIHLVDGSSIRILPQREAAEYALVRSTLLQCLAIEQPRR